MSCWPSASTWRQWLNPAARASPKPARTAAPLPRLASNRVTRTPCSGASSAASAMRAGGSLPSSITKTANPRARSRSTMAGIACQWLWLGITAQARMLAAVMRCRRRPSPMRRPYRGAGYSNCTRPPERRRSTSVTSASGCSTRRNLVWIFAAPSASKPRCRAEKRTTQSTRQTPGTTGRLGKWPASGARSASMRRSSSTPSAVCRQASTRGSTFGDVFMIPGALARACRTRPQARWR